KMYHNGLKYGDYRVAIDAMQALYAMHPERINYLDTLCLLYSQTESYAQVIFTGRDALKANSEYIPVLSAVAVAEQQMGRYKESLELFEKVYSKNSSLYAAYQIAVLNYAMQRY